MRRAIRAMETAVAQTKWERMAASPPQLFGFAIASLLIVAIHLLDGLCSLEKNKIAFPIKQEM
jgi:hypothetical protein